MDSHNQNFSEVQTPNPSQDRRLWLNVSPHIVICQLFLQFETFLQVPMQQNQFWPLVFSRQ